MCTRDPFSNVIHTVWPILHFQNKCPELKGPQSEQFLFTAIVPGKQASAEGNDVPHTAGMQKVPAPYPEPLTARVGHCQWCVPKHLAHCPFKCLYSNTLFRRILRRLISGQLFLCNNKMVCFFLLSWCSYLHTTSHLLVVIFFCYSVLPKPCHMYALTYI